LRTLYSKRLDTTITCRIAGTKGAVDIGLEKKSGNHDNGSKKVHPSGGSGIIKSKQGE
jgi:hypothetical protein